MKKEDIEYKKILSELKTRLKILRKHKVKKIGIFGSYKRGEENTKSDIDFLIEFDLKVFDSNFTGYYDNYIELLSYLENTFKRRIDLLTLDMISPYIKPYIINEVEHIETG